jgi:tetratricopeptide (TPR) repeat protein
MAARSSRRWTVSLLVGLTFANTPAAADPPPSAPAGPEALAEARFREGSIAFDAGRTDEACVAFAESLRLYPNLSTLLNLALCYETQGKTASAWRGFTQGAAWASAPTLHDRRDFAERHALKLQRSLARVEIRSPEGASLALTIDGEPVATSHPESPVFLDPGEHVLEASAPGHVPYVTKVVVPTGSTDAIVVAIPLLRADAVPASATGAPRSPSPGHTAQRVVGVTIGAIGLLAAGLGAYLAADALSKTTGLANCAGGCDPSAARASEVGSAMAFGVGLAGVGAGAWLLSGSRTAPTPATTRLGVTPRIGAEGGEIRLWGTW